MYIVSHVSEFVNHCQSIVGGIPVNLRSFITANSPSQIESDSQIA